MEKWKAVKHETLKGGTIVAPNQNGDGLSEIVAHYYEEADAERIVKAVNCHDDLVEALKELLTGNGEYIIWAVNRGLEALAKAEAL